MRIKKGDTVQILKGKDKGKSGKVVSVNSRHRLITVEGLNLYKKHIRPKRQGEKGEVIQVVRPLPTANVMILCSNCGRPTRVGIRFESGRKFRYCKRCNSLIDK